MVSTESAVPRTMGGQGPWTESSSGGSWKGRGGLSPGMCVLTAEAKAAEAAASAYYNPGNPHNVYMPTVSGGLSGVVGLVATAD